VAVHKTPESISLDRGTDHVHHHGGHAHGGQSLTRALFLTLGFAGVEAVAGWWSGSLALISDAGHMLTDSTALGLAALAAWVARRPPTLKHSYGLARIEILAALLNGVLMLALIAFIAAEAMTGCPAATNGCGHGRRGAGFANNPAWPDAGARREDAQHTRGPAACHGRSPRFTGGTISAR
jgi:heme A synthase